MSGQPDDYSRDPNDPDRLTDEEAVRAAKKAVSIPAIGLICVGALTLFSSVLGLIQMPQVGDRFDEMIQQIQNDPNIPAGQKADQVDILTKARDFVVAYGTPFYATAVVIGALVVLGGVRLLVLKNPAVVVLTAPLAALPVSLCCVLGVVFGIWAVVALMNPVVKAGFAARRRSRYAPDAL